MRRMRSTTLPEPPEYKPSWIFGGGACPSVGLGGRNRRAASHAERARLNVTRAIRATMANLARDNPSLGRHLAATIRTGRYCSHTPIRTRRSPGSVDPGPSAEHPCTPNERRRSRKDPSWEGAVVPVDGPWGAAAVLIHVWIEGSQPLLGRRQSREATRCASTGGWNCSGSSPNWSPRTPSVGQIRARPREPMR